MDRRKILKAGVALSAGAACMRGWPLWAAFRSIASSERTVPSGNRWGLVIDVTRCLADCNACLVACREANNVAYHENTRWDVHRIRKVRIRNKSEPEPRTRTFPVMCNQCENPPCVSVCPVNATYKQADGIVVCDSGRCTGCRECMVACPYNARHFNFKENRNAPNPDMPRRPHGVVESCNFCAERLEEDRIPACVEACEQIRQKALYFGNLNDPDSNVSRLIRENTFKRIREELGTEPKVYYIGM